MQTVVSTGPATLAAADTGRPIDLVHLARMTLGDRSLEREVLQLFARQAGLLMQRLRAAPPDRVEPLAHTLKGSARGLGAWRVAKAAEAVEGAAGDPDALSAAITALGVTVEEACAIVSDLLRAH